MGKSVLHRAFMVYAIISVLSFIATAYYHYTTNATHNYVCTNDTGTLLCQPVDSFNPILFEHYDLNFVSMYPIKRVVGDIPCIAVSKSYLAIKYPYSYGGMEGSQADLSKEKKPLHTELASITKDLEYYESNYKHNAIKFAFKWSVAIPSSLLGLFWLCFALKNFILNGTFRVSSRDS